MEIDLLCHLLDNLIITEVTHLPSEDEDLLCHFFGSLCISGDVFMMPACYNTFPVGYQEEVRKSKGSGLGLHGSVFFSLAKGIGLPWCRLQAYIMTHYYSAGLLFFGRQLKRDFFLFVSCSGVRQKNDWLSVGYFEDVQSWRDILFYILWRYITFVLLQRRLQCVLLLSVMISKQAVPFSATRSSFVSSSTVGFISLHVFSVNFPCLLGLVSSVNGVSITAFISDRYLHGELLRQVVELEEIHFLALSTRETCCVVIRRGYLRRVPDFFAKRDLSLPTRGTAFKFRVIVPLVLIIWVVCYLLMLCYKVGNALLMEMDYPNFDLCCPGRWKLLYGFSGEFNFHTPCGRCGSTLVSWHLSLWRRVQSDYLKKKKFYRVVDHVTPVQTHPYVCGVLLLPFDSPITSIGFWLGNSGYEMLVLFVIRLVCNCFYVLSGLRSCNF